MVRIIAYYRVSTRQQGESGLGLEAQQAAVESYADGLGADVIKSYTEVESGRRSRPMLTAAIGHAKLAGATLVVAKLDRLYRNVAFMSARYGWRCSATRPSSWPGVFFRVGAGGGRRSRDSGRSVRRRQ